MLSIFEYANAHEPIDVKFEFGAKLIEFREEQ